MNSASVLTFVVGAQLPKVERGPKGLKKKAQNKKRFDKNGGCRKTLTADLKDARGRLAHVWWLAYMRGLKLGISVVPIERKVYNVRAPSAHQSLRVCHP